MSSPYKVGIDIAVASNASHVLGAMAAQLFAMHGSVGKLTSAFEKMKIAAIGAVGVFAGIELGKGLIGISKHADKLLDQQDKLLRAGVDMNTTLRLQEQYYRDIAKIVPTATVAEYLKTVNEMRSVVGQEQAEKIAPWALQVEAIIANATGKSAEGEGFKLWRALEMTGRTISDPVGSQKLGDALAQNIIGSGGKLNSGIYQTMAKRAGVAWANASPEFLAGPMSVVAADLGGDTAGTALMSAYMFMTGANTLSKQQYKILKDAKLIDPTKVTEDKGGRINVAPGGIIGSREFSGKGRFDLYGYTQKYLKPHLQALAKVGGGPDDDEDNNVASVFSNLFDATLKHGIAGQKLNEEQQMYFDNYLAKTGRNRNVMRMFTMFSDEDFDVQIQKDIDMWHKARNVVEAYAHYVKDNPLGVDAAYEAQEELMMASIGKTWRIATLPVLVDITELFRQISEYSNEHPDTISAIGQGLAALVAVLVVGGALAIITAVITSPLFLFAAAITGLAYVIYENWPEIKAWFKALPQIIVDWAVALPGKVSKHIDATFKAITDYLSGAIDRLWQHVNPFSKSSYVGPPSGGNMIQTRIEVPVHLDGRVLTRVVMDHVVNGSTFPSSVGAQDGRGSWQSPGSLVYG